MAKEQIPFEHFLVSAGPQHAEFINSLHEALLAGGCKVEITEAKSGYVVSYLHRGSKRVLVNYVFRKKGPMLRIYGDNIFQYMGILQAWPSSMQQTMERATPCARLLAANACNPHCPMGYDYILNGQRMQKCHYKAFQFFLDDESKPCLRNMVDCELKIRND